MGGSRSEAVLNAVNRRTFEYVERLDCICAAPLTGARESFNKCGGWGDVRFVRCDRCGSWCQTPHVTLPSLAAWYDSDDYQGTAHQRGSAYVNYIDDEAARLIEARERHRRDLAPYLRATGARVLEVGCATGSLLAVIRDAGHKVVGIDLSRRFAEVAQARYGLDVHAGDFLTIPLPEESFDMVLLLGTISNLSDIPASLERLRRLLAGGGVLVLNYPVADSVVARAYGSRFWMFAPSVNTFMTERGCRAALAHAGFAVLRSRTDFQRPSLAKLVSHARLRVVLPLIDRLGLARTSVPIRIPIPGVRIAWAKAA